MPTLPQSPAELVALVRERVDGWANQLTGLGTSRDKRTGFLPSPGSKLTDGELAVLWEHDDLAARIVEALPDEALRQGFELRFEGEEGAAVQEAMRRLHVRQQLHDAWIWGRLYGGGAVLVAADDGRSPERPLDEERLRTIHGLHVLDRRDLIAHRWDADPTSPSFGEPETYLLQATATVGAAAREPGRNGGLALSQGVEVHRSRLVLFGGALTSRRRRLELNGWDESVLQRVLDALRDTQSNWQGASALMTDASQAVYKIKNLVEMLKGGNKDALRTRMEMTEMSRSVLRAILLDAEMEDFERKSTSFAGLPDMIDRSWVRLAAAARMPVTILMGQAPAGLNATGESDHRAWENQVQAAQEHVLRGPAERLVRLMLLAQDGPTGGQEPEGWELVFPPLRQSSEKERAEVRKLRAQADALYLDRGVFLADEVALEVAETGSLDREHRLARVELVKRQRLAQAAAGPAPTTPPSPTPGPGAEGPTGFDPEGPGEEE